MGSDGIDGAKVLREKGGLLIAQNEASCVVYGMPKAVIDANLANPDSGCGTILLPQLPPQSEAEPRTGKPNMENSSYNDVEILDALENGDNETIKGAAFAAGTLVLKRQSHCFAKESKARISGVQEAAEYGLRKNTRSGKQLMASCHFLPAMMLPVRNVAMDILREIGVDGIEIMQPYLRGEDPDLRIFITDILGYCASHQSALLLGRRFFKDPEVNVCYQAAVSLGNLAFPLNLLAPCVRPCMMRNGFSLQWWRLWPG